MFRWNWWVRRGYLVVVNELRAYLFSFYTIIIVIIIISQLIQLILFYPLLALLALSYGWCANTCDNGTRRFPAAPQINKQRQAISDKSTHLLTSVVFPA